MLDILDLNVGFWTGILLIIGVIIAVWGAIYAGAASGMLVWIALVALAVLIIWTIGARCKRFLVMGGRRR